MDLSPLSASSTKRTRSSEAKSEISHKPTERHYGDIAGLFALVIIPMAACTGVILWMIFGNLIPSSTCPHSELCMTASQLNNSISDSYLVDIPAARLVFIASWSSTISFGLVGALMTMYSSSLAKKWLHTSRSEASKPGCPTPYETSIVLRVLNAEILAVVQLCWGEIKSVFWNKENATEAMVRSSTVMRGAVVAFMIAILASALVQATDTYLHIVTGSLELLELHSESPGNLPYSIGFAPVCWNRTQEGNDTHDTSEYWGCASGVQKAGNVSLFASIRTNKSTSGKAVRLGIVDITAQKFQDSLQQNDSEVALLVPRLPSEVIDWHATTLGVSTQCRAVRKDSCSFGEPMRDNITGDPIAPFNCKDDALGIRVKGTIVPREPQYQFVDFHRYFKPPFQFERPLPSPENLDGALKEPIKDWTIDSSDPIFRNPWNWRVFVTQGNLLQDTKIDDLGLWTPFSGYVSAMFLDCNTSVWDVRYTMVNQQLTFLNRTRSNSSTTGTISMQLSELWNTAPSVFQDALEESWVFGGGKNLNDRVSEYSKAISRNFISQMGEMIEARPSLNAQSRTKRIVTVVPKVAFWLLMSGNIIFMLLGIVFAGMAIYSSRFPTVHQLSLRLNITGLTALGFEGSFAENRVTACKDLFEEHALQNSINNTVKRVYVEETGNGGAAYTLMEDSHA